MIPLVAICFFPFVVFAVKCIFFLFMSDVIFAINITRIDFCLKWTNVIFISQLSLFISPILEIHTIGYRSRASNKGSRITTRVFLRIYAHLAQCLDSLLIFWCETLEGTYNWKKALLAGSFSVFVKSLVRFVSSSIGYRPTAATPNVPQFSDSMMILFVFTINLAQ